MARVRPPRPKQKRLPEAVSINLTAEVLDVCPRTIRRWIRRGYIKAYRVGPQLVRIPRSEVARMRAIRLPFLIEGDQPKHPVV